MQQPTVITDSDRLKVITFLNNILRQYYSTQPEYLLKRAKQYESMCFKRSQTKQQYYQLVKEGVYKIAKTYEKTTATKAAAAAAAAAAADPTPPQQRGITTTQNLTTVPGTPVTPTIATTAMPISAAPPLTTQSPHTAAATSVKEFLLSLGLTPFPDTIPSSAPPTSATAIPNPNQSFAPPIEIPAPPSSAAQAQPSSAPYPHLPAHANHLPTASRPSSTTTLATNIPPSQHLTTSGTQHMSPPKPSTPSAEPTPQKTAKTPRAKTSTERSRTQRARKRNPAKAGLQNPTPQKAPTHRQIAPKTEVLSTQNTTAAQPSSAHMPTTPPAFQQGSVGAVYNHQVHATPQVNILPRSSAQADIPQQADTRNHPVQDRIYIADEIHVPIAQVYIAAASLGYRLNADIIKRLSRDQVVNIFVRARQVAIAKASNATLNNVAKNNLAPLQDPLGRTTPASNLPASAPVPHPGLLASQPPAEKFEQQLVPPTDAQAVQKTTAPLPANVSGMETGNATTMHQQVQTQNSQLYHIPPQIRNQGLANGSNCSQGITTPASPAHSGATFRGQLRNQNPNAIRNSGNQTISPGKCATSGHSRAAVSNAIPAAGSSQRSGPSSSFLTLAQQTGTGTTPPTPCEPSALQLLVIRLQRFQQKYLVYLKLVQENLAAMMRKRIEGSESQRKFRYMRYAIKLLTCPASDADKISVDIIDKVESFLREYLVIYQGIALKNRAKASPNTAVRGCISGVGVGSYHASNIPVQPVAGSSPDSLLESSQPPIHDSGLVQQCETTVPDTRHLKNPIGSNALSAGQPHTNLNADSQAIDQATRNMALRSIEAQREAMAAAGIRQARDTAEKRILNDRLQAEDAAMPISSPHLQPSSNSAPRASPIASSAQKRTPQDVHSEIAKRVSRVNHYVRMAVHWTDSIEKQLEHEPLLRVREERIAEVCYVVESEKRKRAEQSESGKEKKPEPSLMDIVKKECEDLREKHKKLIIEIGEEWKKPVVNCLLAFKSVRMPKMILHVPGTYMRERRVTFGFERPPMGWIGIVGDVWMKFRSIRKGNEGVTELLEAWLTAAMEVLKGE